MAERSVTETKSRSQRAPSRSSPTRSGARWSSAPRQNTRPITAACCSSRFSRAGRRSMRAAIRAWTLSGMRSVCPLPSVSSSMRAVSSRKRGLPSARSRTSARSAAGVSPAGSRSSASSALSGSGRAASSIAEARGFPPPQVARSSSSSIRARQTIRTGTSRSDRARCSITSSMRSSAHWTSSNTSTSGCASASCSAQRRAAQLVSVDASASSAAPRTPSATPRRSATASLSQHIRSFSNASAAGSSSVIPAEALTIEAIGQNAIPSPYGSARPVSTVARSTPAVNSSTSLDFPTPGRRRP